MKQFMRVCIFIIVSLQSVGFGAERPTWNGVTTPVPLGTLENGYSSWQWLNPLPHGNTTRGIWLFDENNALVSGDRGSLIRTTNAGATWSLQFHVAGQSELGDLFFVDPSIGFMVGRELLKSVDGGFTWGVQPITHPGILNGISFSGSEIGYVVGQSGTILQTVNGGASWWAETISPTIDLYKIATPDSLAAYAIGTDHSIGKAVFVSTSDGGVTWASAPISETIDFIPSGISFVDDSTGWVVGWRYTEWPPMGYIFKTTDGGASWATQTFTSDPYHLYQFMRVDFASPDFGVAVGSSGLIMSTSDGGETWTGSNLRNTWLYNVELLNEQIGIATGEYGTVLRTTDGGASWNDVNATPKEHLMAVAFPDSSRGYAVGFGMPLMRTANGGTGWSTIPSPVGLPSGVSFTDPDHGVVVDGAAAHRTTDGGLTWLTASCGSGAQLWDVFMHADTGFAVGAWGTVARTVDGGSSWTTLSSGTSVQLNGVFFTSGRSGTCVGEEGVILHTTDGGETWLGQPSGTSAALNDVFFVNENVGIIAGYGVILRTDDGGATWTDQTGSAPPFSNLLGMDFATQEVGVMVGWDGAILRTTDAGVTWSEWANTVCTAGLFDVACVRSGSGYVVYAVGAGGSIIVAAMSPQNSRTWTWTGAEDASWGNAGNWFPSSVPQPGDSVLIPPAAASPVMDVVQQQITVASLHILPGGKLTITDALSRLVVLGDIVQEGTLEADSAGATTILVGGSFVTGSGALQQSRVRLRDLPPTASAGAGFIPGRSRVVFNGDGAFSGRFYDLVVEEGARVRSLGNVTVLNQAVLLADVDMNGTDTLFIDSDAWQPLVGSSHIVNGAIVYAGAATVVEAPSDGETNLGLPVAFSWHPAARASAYRLQIAADSAFLTIVVDDSQVIDTAVTVGDLSYETLYYWRVHSTNAGGAGPWSTARSFTTGMSPLTAPHPFFPDIGAADVGLPVTLSWNSVSGADAYRVVVATDSKFLDVVFDDSLAADTNDVPSGLAYGTEYHWRVRALTVGVNGNSGPWSATNRFTTAGFGVGVVAGWNLVSVPLAGGDYSASALYPGAVTGLFAFDPIVGAYAPGATLAAGRGYWIKLPDEDTTIVPGAVLALDSVEVEAGWNLVGSLSAPVPVGQIASDPPGLETSAFYGYAAGYSTATVIEPGRGYWVRVSGSGTLILSAPGQPAPANRIIIADRGESPPPPPDAAVASSGIPLAYSLSQNYPNPFNPTTSIRFAIPLRTHVRIAVFNLVGQEVAALVDEEREAGEFDVEFDAGHLPSGLYVCRMSAGAFVGGTRMLLVK